jgi:hypothetical protein
MRRPPTALGKLVAFPKMTTDSCCCVVVVFDAGLDVELGLDVEPLRLVASEPPEQAVNNAARIARRASRATTTYCPFWSGPVSMRGHRVPRLVTD